MADLYLNKFGMVGVAHPQYRLDNDFFRVHWKKDAYYTAAIIDGLPPSWVCSKDRDVILYDEDVLNRVTDYTNRSVNQTKELLKLFGGDYQVLLVVELYLKRQFLSYCPSTLSEARHVLGRRYENFKLFKI